MNEGKSQSDQKDRKNLLRAMTYIMIILAIIGIIWLLPRVALGTDTPFFSVSSGSMVPTLNVGDYIVVKAESFNNLVKGDIIVFYNPLNPNDIIVHRIYSIDYEQKTIRTKGDHNSYVDPWIVTEEDIIGKYTGFKIPYLGYLALLFPYPVNYILIIAIIIIIFIIELSSTEKKEKNVESLLLFKNIFILCKLFPLYTFYRFFKFIQIIACFLCRCIRSAFVNKCPLIFNPVKFKMIISVLLIIVY
ncbi:MAG: signal peptidase I [archaeon]|nr:signal peptidase I [archaeon]MCP8313324.1 signal peptidase I [archaeon]